VTDARARGVSRPRFGKGVVTTLMVAAGVVAVAVAALAFWHQVRAKAEEPVDAAFAWGVGAFFVLGGLALRPAGERVTEAGRAVAARWLGVRDWLRGHESFADIPPAGVAVWDRYLPYGAALGTTRLASAVIDLGMGNRRRVWSSYGGTWHRVRVRYPWGPRYGGHSFAVAARQVLVIFVGYLLVRYWSGLISDAAAIDNVGENPVTAWSGLIKTVGVLAGLVALGYGGYGLVRVVLDVIVPATVAGQVLWIDVWKQTSGGRNSPARPTVYYFAVDDGRDDRTTAWALPAPLHGSCDTGDTVTLTARRWTRRVISVAKVAASAAATTGGHVG
ncbi:MAG TPA: hypothetical protein VF163_13635, partial [Micromonosporaceae bacterium]